MPLSCVMVAELKVGPHVESAVRPSGSLWPN